MADKGGGLGTLVTVGLVGLAGWWIYENFFAAAAAAAPAAGGVAPQTGAPAASSGTPAAASTAPTTPVYSGPDLDTIYAALQSAVVGAFGTDPALTCPSGAGVSAVSAGATALRSITAPQITIPEQGGHPAAVAGGIPRRTVATGQTSAPSCPAASITATYDVFNYYLMKAVPSIGSAPNPPDHTSTLTLSGYWQWAAPVLQQQIPGLSGLGRAGLGAIWGILR